VTIPTLARDALQTHKNDISWCTQNFVGWWFQPLLKIWKSVGLLFPIYRKNKECSKPPTRGGMVPKTLDFDWFFPSYQPFSIHIWIWTDAFLIAFRFGNNYNDWHIGLKQFKTILLFSTCSTTVCILR
jgi:hypothetical protein